MPALKLNTLQTLGLIAPRPPQKTSSLADAIAKSLSPATRPASAPSTWQPSKPSAPAVTIAPTAPVAKPMDASRAAAIADTVRSLALSRGNGLTDAQRIARMQEAVGALSAYDVETVRRVYISKFGADPEMDLRGLGLGQVLDLSPQTEEALVTLFNGPRARQDAAFISKLADKAARAALTQDDRSALYEKMATIGFPYGRELLAREFQKATGKSLDVVLDGIYAKLPPAQLSTSAAPEKSVAVVVSSVAAHWEELTDWAKPLVDAGYHLQIFTPDGKPVAFQHDSLLYSEKTSPMGFGAPPRIAVDTEAGAVSRELASHAAPASAFDPSKFAQVMVVGGLGTDRDLTNNPKIQSLVMRGFEAGLDVASICHGPTVFAKTMVDPDHDGHAEPLAKGVAMVGLPNALETYAIAGGRVADVFLNPPPINVGQTLMAAGAKFTPLTDLRDVLQQSRVVVDQKAGRRIATGVGPLAARNLAQESIRLLQSRVARN